ncbi:GNAT family N-acetyltransferase [Pseudomonas asiatica]|uniref:GNAT family N-acetyltransferase n=1 Tax=Pseudomonas asiatica TaxID=2219225 RepID=UPI0025AAF492|nr:GNAT family N-acetyltransferase [Pseudomonas asiatica]MDM9552441.1 GNAT family N-acetyltransferase [Pseudomonas asiatica]
MNVKTPELNAHEDAWEEYADAACLHLKQKLSVFLQEQFGLTKSKVNRHLHIGLGSTVKADNPKYGYDLYFRLFPNLKAGWPRETLVIARIFFEEQRKGHGRNLLNWLVQLAPEIGYKYIAIEAANENSSAFGKRFGFELKNGKAGWLGSVENLEQALC